MLWYLVSALLTSDYYYLPSLQPEKQEFDECIDTFDDRMTFADMNLSRPLVKALSSMNFVQPTPIQSACIPVALKGRDICACAVTGSGNHLKLPSTEMLARNSQNPSGCLLE